MPAKEPIHEPSYEIGYRQAWRHVLGEAVRALGYDTPEATKVAWISEREAAIAQLREVCAEYGDNDWGNNLHLADIIGKHLARYLSTTTDAK